MLRRLPRGGRSFVSGREPNAARAVGVEAVPPIPHPSAPTVQKGESEPVRYWVGVVPRAADCFQPREVADRLIEAAQEGETVVVSQVLAGMGGIGKTQLAAAYARRVWERREVEVVVWVSATSRSQILAAYAQAATELGLPTDPGDVEQAARRFLTWAQTTPTAWLVVLDDVQDPADVRELWPSGAAGRVVVTTRRREAALTRQDVLKRERPPELYALIDEAAL
ncbi:NB-ARC domain-containing protein, partial [Streptosporangium sp. NPDC049644]|uniref:NB-ARC domain-containing protein n=1 Tax=Streptosporangium sp. NPDC049644 TaxID=3155507 RepID=UPI003421E36A